MCMIRSSGCCLMFPLLRSSIPGFMHRIMEKGLVTLGRFSICAESVYYVSNYISLPDASRQAAVDNG